jgi:hypothetical protein
MIKCFVPSLHDQAKKIYRERVKVSIAMNGQDYNDGLSDVYIVLKGTGSKYSFWPWLFGTILVALLIIAIFLVVMAWWQKISLQPARAPAGAQPNRGPKSLMFRG